MPSQSNPLGGKNFVSIKEILSIGGSGIATWGICCVFLTLFPGVQDSTATLLLRYSAIILSLAFSYIIYRNTHFKLEDDRDQPNSNYSINVFILLLVNASLIYLNAVGVNSISNGTPFEKKTSKQSNLIPFFRDVSWWPDAKLVQENDILKMENQSLLDEHTRAKLNFRINVYNRAYSPIPGADVMVRPDDDTVLFKGHTNDSGFVVIPVLLKFNANYSKVGLYIVKNGYKEFGDVNIILRKNDRGYSRGIMLSPVP